MKIFIICSKAFYNKIEPIQKELEKRGHEVFLPNTYKNPEAESKSWDMGEEQHITFKQKMFHMSADKIANMDAVLTLNFDKNGQANYIGGSTFLELYEAFMKNKKIYLYHDIPQGMLYDEIQGFGSIVIHEDLDKI